MAPISCPTHGPKGKEEEHKLTRALRMGAWLTAIPNRKNGTALSAEEFRDNLHLRYGMQPLNLSKFV
jgi:hypothetical protein